MHEVISRPMHSFIKASDLSPGIIDVKNIDPKNKKHKKTCF